MSAKSLFASSAFRFSLRQLLAWTAVVGLACVALRGASPAWVAALLGLVLLVLGAAVLLAIYRSGPQRAFWLGFAIFGWLYLLLLAYSWNLDPKAAATNPLAPPGLLTAQLSTRGYERIYGDPAGSVESVSYRVAPTGGQLITIVSKSDLSSVDESAVLAAIDPAGGFSSNLSLVVTGGQKVHQEPARRDFVNVAHAFWTLLLAAVGGWFTRWLYATRPRSSEASGL